ncbi:MAG: NAD(P)/FAD-dependent oxidoreductase [Coleofasciculaceae cyanobacterium]
MSNPVYQTVILGGGFAGLFTALHLSHEHYPRSIILIDQNERFCFKPLLYEYFSGEMEPDQVVPRYQELLAGSGVIFVQDTVQKIDLPQKEIQLASGDKYSYSNLVLALGSVTGYFDVEGAQEYALPLRTQADAIAIDHHLRDCLDRAIQLQDLEQRRRLLTAVVVGGGPSGVEMTATLADLLPQWYEAMGGNRDEVRVILVNHGEILKGDINSRLRETAEQALQNRAVPAELIIGAEVKEISAHAIAYKRDGQIQTLNAGTVIWTTGTNTHPLVKSLPIPEQHRDKHGRLNVTPTLQLPDFPEVFAGGDCAVDLQPTKAHDDNSSEEQHQEAKPLPPTAQVAYQQGNAIAHNLRAIALGNELKPAKVNLRGTLLKLGLNEGVANLFDSIEISGEVGHLIRQGSYLELLPTPLHDFKATTEWLKEEIFEKHHPDSLKQAVVAAEIVGGVVIGALIARKLLKTLSSKPEQD